MAKCIAPECEDGKVFGEECRACKGTGLIIQVCSKCHNKCRVEHMYHVAVETGPDTEEIVMMCMSCLTEFLEG